MVKQYIKKPVTVEAVRWRGYNFDEIRDFVTVDGLCFLRKFDPPRVLIPTLEGGHIALVGDYIIRGVKGEYYPCKPDIFRMTYMEATK